MAFVGGWVAFELSRTRMCFQWHLELSRRSDHLRSQFLACGRPWSLAKAGGAVPEVGVDGFVRLWRRHMQLFIKMFLLASRFVEEKRKLPSHLTPVFKATACGFIPEWSNFRARKSRIWRSAIWPIRRYLWCSYMAHIAPKPLKHQVYGFLGVFLGLPPLIPTSNTKFLGDMGVRRGCLYVPQFSTLPPTS